jgi:hypothetical protein
MCLTQNFREMSPRNTRSRRQFCLLDAQMTHEVDPDRNVVDVHEQAVRSERISKSIAQPARRAGRVTSTVVDENRASHGYLGTLF